MVQTPKKQVFIIDRCGKAVGPLSDIRLTIEDKSLFLIGTDPDGETCKRPCTDALRYERLYKDIDDSVVVLSDTGIGSHSELLLEEYKDNSAFIQHQDTRHGALLGGLLLFAALLYRSTDPGEFLFIVGMGTLFVVTVSIAFIMLVYQKWTETRARRARVLEPKLNFNTLRLIKYKERHDWGHDYRVIKWATGVIIFVIAVMSILCLGYGICKYADSLQEADTQPKSVDQHYGGTGQKRLVRLHENHGFTLPDLFGGEGAEGRGTVRCLSWPQPSRGSLPALLRST